MWVYEYMCFQKFERLYLENDSINGIEVSSTIKVLIAL